MTSMRRNIVRFLESHGKKKYYTQLEIPDLVSAAGGEETLRRKFKTSDDVYAHLMDHHEKLIKQKLQTHEEVGHVDPTRLSDWCDSRWPSSIKESKDELEQVAKLACQKAQRTNDPADHEAAAKAHEVVANKIGNWLDQRGRQYSARMGAHGDCAISHRQRIRGTAKFDQGPFMFSKGRASESVMTTIYHDFYGNRTGINNRIPICPVCGLPVNDDFYGNRGTDASLRDGKRCTCKIAIT